MTNFNPNNFHQRSPDSGDLRYKRGVFTKGIWVTSRPGNDVPGPHSPRRAARVQEVGVQGLRVIFFLINLQSLTSNSSSSSLTSNLLNSDQLFTTHRSPSTMNRDPFQTS